MGAHVAARSRHPGGVCVSLVDASTRFVSDNIDLYVVALDGNAAGGEAISVP